MMEPALKKSALFAQMTEQEIQSCLLCSRAEIVDYAKDQPVFFQQDTPRSLFVLIHGSVAVCRDSASGSHSIITTISHPGDLFGEVYLFLQKKQYDNYAVAVSESRVLQMPKDFLYHTCGQNCDYHTLLISNMLSILAQKAYYLNQKLQIMSSATLRQKIAKVLLRSITQDQVVRLKTSREKLADYLNVARPSLSRELMKMQDDGLLKVNGKEIKIIDLQQMQNLL